MIGRDVERMPYGLAALALIVVAPVAFLWSSVAFATGQSGLLAGLGIGATVVLISDFLNRIMVRKGYRDDTERKPVSITEWILLAAMVGLIGAMAFYSEQTAFIGYLIALLVWLIADLWSRRKLSK